MRDMYGGRGLLLLVPGFPMGSQYGPLLSVTRSQVWAPVLEVACKSAQVGKQENAELGGY